MNAGVSEEFRYFGGVKLGTGGLVRAYSDAVSECLADVPRAKRVTAMIEESLPPAPVRYW